MTPVKAKAPILDWVQPASAPAFRVLFVLTLIAAAAVCSAVIPRALRGAQEKALRTKCAQNLRHLSISAIQYADDKRFYPHVERMRDLDGGYDTDHSSRKVQALEYYGYHGNPEGWVCPASEDTVLPPRRNPEGADQRLFWWRAGIEQPSGRSPFNDGLQRPSLRETSELSYGSNRKAMSTGTRCTSVLFADRAVYHRADEDPDTLKAGEIGSHGKGYFVAYADASVTWRPAGSEDADTRWDLRTVDVLKSSLSNPPRKRVVPLRPAEAGVAAAFPMGFLLLLGWMRHMGWRRRVPDRVFLRRRSKRRRRWITAVVVGAAGRAEALEGALLRAPGKPGVTLGLNQRCPYCHAAVAEVDDLVECRSCRTLLHRECSGAGGPGGRCSTLGCLNA